MDCHGLPWIAMGCHGIMFPPDLPFKPKWSLRSLQLLHKRLLQEAPFFLHLFVFLFFACSWHVCLWYINVFYRVTLSFAMILSLETQLYTPLFLLINQLLTSTLRPKEARRFAKPAMTWTHSRERPWFFGCRWSGSWVQVEQNTGWWFGTCFIFHNIWDNPSHWLIFFKMV